MVPSKRFLKTKDYQVFLQTYQYNSRFNYETVENFTYLTSHGTAFKFMNVVGPFAKKLEVLLFSEIVVIGQSSSKCPGSSSRIVKRQRESEKQKACNSARATIFFSCLLVSTPANLTKSSPFYHKLSKVKSYK